MRSLNLFNSHPLPGQLERELIAEHEAEIGDLLPMLGPLFGLGVILFSVWDFLIDSLHAPAALVLRIALVLLGSVAYGPPELRWTSSRRCGYIYCTHASAIIIAEFLLKDGFIYGLAGISACVFTVSVVTFRVKTFLQILCIPTLVFIVLSAISTPLLTFINGLMLYFFSVFLAGLLMMVMRSLRRNAFLLEKELIHISRHDSLTGACNRRCLGELAEREIALAERHGRPLAIAMLDIDHFKLVNDTYGHDVGDEAIKAFVKTCESNLREIDHFGRIGGEEFVCILPETAKAEALLCAERLRLSIEALRIEIPQRTLQFTVSIGVALRDPAHSDWNALLKAADDALYQAKRTGRNRTVLWEESRDTPENDG
jgi:diguanylate cyclase (GGDEF)-like protein